MLLPIARNDTGGVGNEARLENLLAVCARHLCRLPSDMTVRR